MAKHWRFSLAVILALILTSVYLWPRPDAGEPEMTEEQFVQELAESHIQGNVPAAQDFQSFLTRDLNLHFGSQTDRPSVKGIEMLRDGPTQVGVSSPKFYVWVTLLDGREAAVKVAAENRTRFHVMQVFFASEIRQNRKAMDGQLPPPVIEKALQKLK